VIGPNVRPTAAIAEKVPITYTEMEGAEDMFCQYRGFDQDTAVRKASRQLKNHERDKSLDPERESDGQGDYDVTNGNTLERGQIE
jgi:hypothetical protein